MLKSPARIVVAICFVSIAAAWRQSKTEFTIALIPDTQNYTDIDPQLNYEQMRFIARSRDTANLVFAIHLGDLTDSNLEEPLEWGVAIAAHKILDSAKVPYSVIPGNHDMPYLAGQDSVLSRDLSVFNQFFGPARFTNTNGTALPWTGFAGYMPSAPENKYWLFERNGLKFAVIGLEMAPRKEAVCWANDVAKRLSDRRIIVSTHCYQTHDGKHQTNCAVRYGLVGSGGDVLFAELIKLHSNIVLVLSGHINEAEYMARPREFGPSRQDSVHEILTDYQNERNAHNQKSGNGWLRLMTFYPAKDSVVVKAHSVSSVQSFNQSDYASSKDHTDHSFAFKMPLSQMRPAKHIDALDAFHDRTVNPLSKGQQYQPALAATGNGRFVSAWTDDADGNGKNQIHARAFDANGCELFRITPVNRNEAGDQRDPAVAVNTSGTSVIVWESDHDNDGNYDVRARGFKPDGSLAFEEIAVSSTNKGQQTNPAVSVANSGEFVVVWQDDSDEDHVYQIKARLFRADGNPQTTGNGNLIPELLLEGGNKGHQRNPDIAATPAGAQVIVWEDDRDGNGSYQIRARGYQANRNDWFGPITVNTTASGQQVQPAVSVAKSGAFAVVWADDRNDNGLYQIRGQRFGSNGSPSSSNDFVVNTTNAGQQIHPDVAMAPEGGFVVVWADDRNDNDTYQIRSRSFDRNGNGDAGDTRVNFNSAGQQLRPVVGVLTNSGRVVVAWQDDSNVNSQYEILVRGLPVLPRLATVAGP